MIEQLRLSFAAESKMAALFNHSDFWNLGSDAAINAVIKHHRKDFVTFSWVQGIILCLINPLIVFGNAFVVYAVWKDPLRNLRRSPTNFILQSMADLLVGLVLSPMYEYWLFSEAVAQHSELSFHVIFSLAFILIGASLGHLLLLSIDRFFVVIKPLKYKSIMTRRRIHLVTSVLWLYFICFGIAIFLIENSFFVANIVFSVQMFIFLQITFCFYGLTIYRLRRNCKVWHKRILHGSVYVSHQEDYPNRERRLAKSMALLICVSLFLITPFFVLACLLYFCIQCYSHSEMFFVSAGVELTLVYLHSVGNPFLYCWRLPRYRELLKFYFKKLFRCCTTVEKKYREREVFDTKL